MSVQCVFFPTPKGWYLEVVCGRDDWAKLGSVYGPANSLAELDLFRCYCLGLHDKVEVRRDIKVAPALSPNGSPVAPVELDHRTGWDSFGAPASRFLTTKDDLRNYAIYDTMTDVVFSIPRPEYRKPHRVKAVFGRRAWREGVAPLFPSQATPKTDDGWALLARDAVYALVLAGWEYNPIIIPGIPYQPISLKALATL